MKHLSFSSGSIAKWLKYAEWGAYTLLLILPVQHGLFRIALALHIGLSIVTYSFYCVIIYLKSFDNKETPTQGNTFIQILNFVPLIISRVANSFLTVISKAYALITGTKTRDLSTYAGPITFGLISLRKLISLACWCYVTNIDNKGVHLKTFVLFCICHLVQCRFIIQGHSFFKKAPQLPWREAIKYSFKNRTSMSPHLQSSYLKFKRLLLFRLSALLTAVCLGYLYNGFFENSYHQFDVYDVLAKIMLFIDIQLASTIWNESTGLSVSLVDTSYSNV